MQKNDIICLEFYFKTVLKIDYKWEKAEAGD